MAADVLDVVLLPARAADTLARRLEPMLPYEAIDPDAERLSLLQRVDQVPVHGLFRGPWRRALSLADG